MVQSVLMEFKKLKRQKLTYVLLVALIIIITIDQFLIRMSTARYEGVVQYKHATTHFIEQLDPLATFLIVFIPLFVMGMFGFCSSMSCILLQLSTVLCGSILQRILSNG